MELYPPLELDGSSLVDRAKDRGSAPLVERLIELSSWMMVLGTVRVVCMLADYVAAFVEATRDSSRSRCGRSRGWPKRFIRWWH